MPPAIAALVRAGRLRKGLNQEELAQRAGVSRTTLHHLERGAIQHPRATTLSRLAAVLELDPRELARDWRPGPFDREGTPPSNGQTAFDWSTNAVVAEVVEREPQRFAGFSASDWEELVSQVGVGGGLTYDGVLAAAERLQTDKETLARLRLVLQTHLREPAQQLIDALYQSIAIVPPGGISVAPAPTRE